MQKLWAKTFQTLRVGVGSTGEKERSEENMDITQLITVYTSNTAIV